VGALQDVKDYLASIGVPAGRYSDAALNQAIATEAAAQSKKCRVPSVDLPDGLALWFRAEDLAGLADGDPVSSWTSAAGTSVATQGTGSAQPTKRTLDGKDSVRFDGVNDWLALDGDALTFSNAAAGVTLITRFKRNAAQDRSIFSIYTGGSAVRYRLLTASSVWKFGGRRLDADSFVEIGTGSAADQGVHTVSGVIDYARTSISLYVDGVLDASSTSFQTAGVASATNSTLAAFGAQADGQFPLSADLYEFLAWPRALSATERALAEDYLSGGGLPWPLRESLARRVVINFARRGVTLGVVEQASDGGSPSFIPRQDAEVKRLEAPYRKLVVG